MIFKGHVSLASLLVGGLGVLGACATHEGPRVPASQLTMHKDCALLSAPFFDISPRIKSASDFYDIFSSYRDPSVPLRYSIPGGPVNTSLWFKGNRIQVFHRLASLGSSSDIYLGVFDGNVVVIKNILPMGNFETHELRKFHKVFWTDVHHTQFLERKGVPVLPLIDYSERDMILIKRFVPGWTEVELAEQLPSKHPALLEALRFKSCFEKWFKQVTSSNNTA